MTSDAATTFGDSLRRLRAAAGLTQPELAERAGLSVRGINDLERGARRSPRKDTIALLADALSLSPEQRAALFVAAKRPTSPTLQDVAPVEATLDRHRHNLPVPPTPLVGREDEVAATRALLLRAEVRLLTLTGPGGIGKTRLGLEVAAELLRHFVDGVYLVELGAITDPSLVLTAIAQTVGVREAQGRSLEEGLHAALRDQHMLLVLDNCEHLIAAAPLVARLLAACPGLQVLATSRRPLRLRAEREYPVPPLAVPEGEPIPDATALARYPAVALFVQRAQGVQPDFQLTANTAPVAAAICAQLDGLPLAIELAAVWIKVLPLPTLRARLAHRLELLVEGPQDLPMRQQTLRNTLEWSHNLLAPADQRLFRRLAVCVGGCTLEAGAAIGCVMGNPPAEDLLLGLGSLVDKSLIWQQEQGNGEARFGMLETVREYALEQLEASGEAEALRRAHAGYFRDLAVRAEPEHEGRSRRNGCCWWTGR